MTDRPLSTQAQILRRLDAFMPLPEPPKFTPGPWEIDGAKDHEHRYHEIIAPIPTHREATSEFNFTVADTLNRDSRISPDEDTANAHLLSAGPELYWAVRGLLELVDKQRFVGEGDSLNAEWKAGIVSDARDAIAKADGGSQ